MNPKTPWITTLLIVAGQSLALAQSAWLPQKNQINITPGFAFSSFDQFWAGDNKVDNPPNGKSLDQYSGFLNLDYGILGNLAADATFGYTATDTGAFGGNVSDDGLMDTSLGLRYRVLDENQTTCPFAPTIALRAGVVIAGTYDSNLPFSAGDGAHGFEGSVLFGKSFGNTGFGLYGDIGYRVRESPVPHDLYGSIGVFKQIQSWTLLVGYRHIQSLSGLDIGGPGFNPAAGRASGFPALREVNRLIEGGVTYTDKRGWSYQLSVAGSIDGRNTGDKLMVGVNATIPFGGR